MSDESRQIVHIHAGQAGIQMGEALWRQYNFEHQVSLDGHTFCSQGERKLSVYNEKNGLVFPRAVLVDSDPATIEKIKSGFYRRLFEEELLVSGKEDAASCFERSAFIAGKEANGVFSRATNAIRLAAESCDRLEGFQLMRSISGGTGSGLGSVLLQMLRDEFSKKVKLELCLFPSPNMSTIVVEAYNAILATHASMDSSDLTVLFDNESCYHRNRCSLAMDHSNYDQINRTISLVLSGLTASFRFKSIHNTCMSDLQTNLVAFQDQHFPILSFSPIASRCHPCHLDTIQITERCFAPPSQMLRCDPKDGMYMACCLFYRGKVTAERVAIAKKHVQNLEGVKFASYAAGAFKEEITPKIAPHYNSDFDMIAESDRALCMIANNTVIAERWDQILRQCDKLFAQKAYIHHFASEGMTESALSECKESIKKLIDGYRAQGSVPVEKKPASEEPSVQPEAEGN